MAHKTIYGMKDVAIKIYRDTSTPGIAPANWSSGLALACVATGFSYSPKQDAALVHGQGSNQPVATRKGVITYEWTIDALYTNDTYAMGSALKLSQFIESEMGFFAMQIIDGADTKVFTYVSLTSTPQKISEGEALSCNMEGIAEAVATT
jgi:hypothetical protein